MTKHDDGPTPREVLSANLRALIKKHPTLTGIKKVADATMDYRLNGEDVHLSNGKVGRIAAGSHTTDIDALYSLAKAFELEPWQLLVPDLDPEHLPALSTTPLLEQIKALVIAQTGDVRQKDEASAEQDSSENEGVTARNPNARSRKHIATPSLDAALIKEPVRKRTSKKGSR